MQGLSQEARAGIAVQERYRLTLMRVSRLMAHRGRSLAAFNKVFAKPWSIERARFAPGGRLLQKPQEPPGASEARQMESGPLYSFCLKGVRHTAPIENSGLCTRTVCGMGLDRSDWVKHRLCCSCSPCNVCHAENVRQKRCGIRPRVSERISEILLSRADLTQCPYCSSPVRRDRIEGHIGRVHAADCRSHTRRRRRRSKIYVVLSQDQRARRRRPSRRARKQEARPAGVRRIRFLQGGSPGLGRRR
jgi:hypothetical protein